MTISSEGEEVGSVPLSDIGVVLVSAHGATYTNNLLVALAEHGVSLVICAQNYLPCAWLWPTTAHHLQAERMAAQLRATRPMGKRLWREIVRSKIRQQANVLALLGRPVSGLRRLSERVRSGDSGNVEAQAARRYWSLAFGSDFRRNKHACDAANVFLNYGYTVLRAATARAIVSTGLHPSVGIHHSNKYDQLRLADDLMEPFRPFVDMVAIALVRNGATELSVDAKRDLALVLSRDIRADAGTTSVSACLLQLTHSLAQSYLSHKIQLDLPPASPLSDPVSWGLL